MPGGQDIALDNIYYVSINATVFSEGGIAV
jgi:hypothetical protein